MRRPHALVALAFLLVVPSCVPFPTEEDYENLDFCPSVRRVAFDRASLALHVGDTVTVRAVARDERDEPNILCDFATWSSSNAAVASVTSTGRVEGVSAGTAYIRATIEGRTDSLLVTASAAP